MGNRWFQCAMCKKLSVIDDSDCYVLKAGSTDRTTWTTQIDKIDNEVCECTGAKRRIRELKSQVQYDMEVALNRPINQ